LNFLRDCAGWRAFDARQPVVCWCLASSVRLIAPGETEWLIRARSSEVDFNLTRESSSPTKDIERDRVNPDPIRFSVLPSKCGIIMRRSEHKP
jgi:hypothetical protein